MKKKYKTAIKVVIYSKTDCHLCDEAKAVLSMAQGKIPFELTEKDITEDPSLFEKYKEKIPVIFINGRKAFKYRVNEKELIKKLKRA